ncbi:MAG: multiubiquitin domain-containing protein [Acidobacteriota bacterium]
MDKPHDEDKKFIPIQIDHKPYKAPKTPMTGAELRALAEPPIGADRDLFRVVPGPGDDVKVEDNDSVALEPGMHFYSAPKQINPGGQANAASGR